MAGDALLLHDILHHKTSRLQHLAGALIHRPGGQGGPRGGQAGELLAPGEGKAIEMKGIGAGLELRQGLNWIAEDQVEGDAPPVEAQPMDARQQGRPLPAKFGRQRIELGPGGVQPGQVGGAEGVFFDGDEVQAAAARRVGPPGTPGGEEAQAGPEARLDDGEGLAAAPAGRQPMAALQDLQHRHGPAGVGGVVKAGRRGAAVGVEGQGGGGDRGVHGREGIGSQPGF